MDEVIGNLEVCKAARFIWQSQTGRQSIDSVLSEATGLPTSVCMSAIENAIQQGFLQCGVSKRFAWLTEKGKQLLQFDHA